jgi:ribosomal protein L37AE/L43A
MREFTKRVIASLVASVIFSSVLFLLTERSAYGQELKEAITPYAAYFLLAVVIFGGIYIALTKYTQNMQEIEEKNRSGAFLIKGEPEYPEQEGEIEKFGVVWKAVYGSNRMRRGRGNYYTYIKGCYCPHCDTQLNRKTVPRLIYLQKKVWKCPTCEKTYSRPNLHGESPQENIEPVFDAMFEGRLDEIEDSSSASQETSDGDT